MISSAQISDDGRYRYALMREWQTSHPPLLVVMLNPSTADASVNDPTITRLVVRAQVEGFGKLIVCNLYAFRTAYPAKLVAARARQVDVIGPLNDEVIANMAQFCHTTLIAWGSHPLVRRREQTVLGILRAAGTYVNVLQLTKDGFPKHPLHLAYAVGMRPYRGRFA